MTAFIVCFAVNIVVFAIGYTTGRRDEQRMWLGRRRPGDP